MEKLKAILDINGNYILICLLVVFLYYGAIIKHFL